MIIKRKTYDSSSDTEGSCATVEVTQPNQEVLKQTKVKRQYICIGYDQCCGLLLLGGVTGIFIWRFWPNILSAY